MITITVQAIQRVTELAVHATPRIVKVEVTGTARGKKGDKGNDGRSAYQVWLDNGNAGSEQEFLDSLKGNDGNDTTFVAGENISAGKLITVVSGIAYYAQLSDIQNPTGFSVNAALVGENVIVRSSGTLALTGAPLLANTDYFMHNNGSISHIAPTSNKQQVVATSYSTSEITVNIQLAIFLI